MTLYATSGMARYFEEEAGSGAGGAAILAHHWREAGDAERAVGYLISAAELAGHGWAAEEAIALYNEALELIPENDERHTNTFDGRPIVFRAGAFTGRYHSVRRTVEQLCRASSRFVYVTTRFHPEPSGLLDFTTDFETDPTHITLLAKDFLRCLFVLEGFRRRADLEERMDWGGKGRVLVYERA